MLHKVHHSIRALEHHIDKVKLLYTLGKIKHADARSRIKELEKELREEIEALPTYERHVYKIRKEFGKDF